jgi:ParB/RepB/Spo0J family partition protein
MRLPTSTLQELPLALLEVPTGYVRLTDSVRDQALPRSIERSDIMYPLHVHKVDEERFQIVDGRRRYRCAQLLGMETLPCLVHEKLSKGDYAYLYYVLNDAKPWTQAETAKALRQLRDLKDPHYDELRKTIDLIRLEEI